MWKNRAFISFLGFRDHGDEDFSFHYKYSSSSSEVQVSLVLEYSEHCNLPSLIIGTTPTDFCLYRLNESELVFEPLSDRTESRIALKRFTFLSRRALLYSARPILTMPERQKMKQHYRVGMM